MNILTENYKLYLGDCLEVMDRLIEEGIVVDAIICDPPYGTTACKWDSVIPFEEMWDRINKLIKPNGAIVLFGSQPFTSNLILSNVKFFKEQLIWEKHKPSNFGCAKHKHMKYHEDIVVFYKKQCTYNPQMIKRDSTRIAQGQKTNYCKTSTVREDGQEVSFKTKYKPKNFNEYDKDTKLPSTILKGFYLLNNSHEKTSHPTQKPLSLMEYLIKTYTNKNDLVLDFTMGSGSTGVACMNTNRKFIGIELDSNYFDIAINRIFENYK